MSIMGALNIYCYTDVGVRIFTVRFEAGMPLLLRQPIISTALDAHGEKLSLDELRSLFESLPEELVINDNHDLSQPSAATARNLQLSQLDSGEWAIIADIDVTNESLLAKRGGFSMAWLAATYTVAPERAPDIQVLFNPRIFRTELAISVASTTDNSINVVGRELKQKGLESTAILIVQFLGGAALAGFIGKIGSDLYDKLLSILARASDDLIAQNDSEVLVQFLVPRHLNPYDADVIVELPQHQIEHLRVGSLSFQDAIEVARLVPHAELAKKIVVRASGEPPRWQLSSYEKSSGLQIRI